MTSKLTDVRIAEIGAKLASYGFKDHLGHSLTNCQDFQDLLAEVKALRVEKAQAEAVVLLVYQIRQTINNINVLHPTTCKERR